MTHIPAGCRTRPRCGSRWLPEWNRSRWLQVHLLGDRGSSTWEAALLIPLLTVVAASIIGVLSWVWNGFGAGDAVGQAARSVARGENQWVVHQQLQSMMPDATIYWSVGESTVRVRVERWEYISTAILGEHWQKVVQEATAPIEGAQG